jgi:hypothetical protein
MKAHKMVQIARSHVEEERRVRLADRIAVGEARVREAAWGPLARPVPMTEGYARANGLPWPEKEGIDGQN